MSDTDAERWQRANEPVKNRHINTTCRRDRHLEGEGIMGGRIELMEVGWVRTEDCIPTAMVGERFVCLVPTWLRNAANPSYSVEVLEATEDGWQNENHFVIEDSVAWCSEHDFNAAAVEVFGEITWEAE